MQVSGQLHILAAYSPVGKPLVHTGQESEWASKLGMKNRFLPPLGTKPWLTNLEPTTLLGD
jgi:hypothetical protein